MTSYVFLWECPDGERRWEAVKKEQIDGFLEKLLTDGVHPATIMIAYAPILFHWVWKKFHNGMSDVNFHNINEEIYGTAPVEESKHKPIAVPAVKETPAMKYGWISPDGRFFGCDYGGHSCLASKIVGEVQYVADPERHLEGFGWAKVLSGRSVGKQYAIGMGVGKSLTDAQLKTIQCIGLERAYGISELLWKGGTK